jgi:hypothetical protein
VVIIINYVWVFLTWVFCFWNFLHMICTSSQIKLKYKFNTVISWQQYAICVKCYMKHFVKGGNHVSNDIRIWWVLHVLKFLILWPQTFLTILKIKQNAPYYIKNLEIFNDRIFRYSRILRRIYTFHIQCIIKIEDLNALYLEN